MTDPLAHPRGEPRHHGRGRSPTAWLDGIRLPAILLAVVVVGSVLAVGTVHLPVLAIVAAVTLAAVTALVVRGPAPDRPALVAWPALLCLGLAGFTLLQTIPLPIGWLHAIAPSTADVWERCLLPFGEAGPRWASLSLDPGASTVEALKWTVYAGVFTVAANISRLHGSRWGVGLVFVSALAAALVTLGHGLLGATAVYGLYTPTFRTAAWHMGPLLNTNNLAGYLNLGVLCGLGLMMARRATLPAWLLGPGIAAIVGIEVTSASRGGVAVLPFGIAALALITRRREHRAGVPAGPWARLMVLAVAGGALLAQLGGTFGVWSELFDRDLSKIKMVAWAKPLVLDYPIFGVGRGAFESVFPLYRQTLGNFVFTHAENFPVQWAAEWGLPVGVAALGAFAWGLRPRALLLHKGSIAAGAWIGVVVVLVQNLLDLALEVPGVCIAIATVMGSLWGEADRVAGRGRPHPDEEPARPRALGLLIAIGGVLLVLLALRSGSDDVASDRARVRGALADDQGRLRTPAPPLRDLLRAPMLRHPAEPYFPLQGALVAFRERREDPMPWLQRSLERGRVNGRAHLLLAEVVGARGGRRQALLELRLAMQDDPDMTWPAALLAGKWADSLDDVLVAAHEGKAGAVFLSQLGAVLGAAPARGALAAQCDRAATQRDGALVEPRLREADRRVAALADPASRLCPDRARCREEVLAEATAIAGLEPDRATAIMLRARLLVAEGKPSEAAILLAESCQRHADRAACERARADAASRVKDATPLDAAAKDLLASVCTSSTECADAATWLASLRTARGEAGAALLLLARAAHEAPLDERRWLALATAASAAGAHGQALDALETVARVRGGSDDALRKRIDEERGHTFRGMISP